MKFYGTGMVDIDTCIHE